jgi:hypothetical protein
MTILSLVASTPQMQSLRRARDFIDELAAKGLMIVPTRGSFDLDELLVSAGHNPMCEAMRPDDVPQALQPQIVRGKEY